jgi:hypothetical protein
LPLPNVFDQKLQRIYQLANYRVCPNLKSLQPSPQPLSRAERQALQESLNSWASMPTQNPHNSPSQSYILNHAMNPRTVTFLNELTSAIVIQRGVSPVLLLADRCHHTTRL